jgi:hypothetical protein
VRRLEGQYLLRTNPTESGPAKLWSLYCNWWRWKKRSRSSKAIWRSGRSSSKREKPRRGTHLRVVFGLLPARDAYRAAATLAPGLTKRSVLEKFAAVQMIDMHLPTTDGRQIILTRTTQPSPN